MSEGRPQPATVERDGSAAARAVVGIAASAGGPNAIAEVLAGLGEIEAAILVVQHIQPAFVGRFVEWMSRASELPVSMAVEGDVVRSATVYVSPGDQHLKLSSAGRIRLDSEPESLHRPSADELFRSLAAYRSGNVVGVVLSGMGEDGAQGLLELRRGGGTTIAQDESSSLIYGMPKAAAKLGAAEAILPLDAIAAAICSAVRKRRR
jgi:two-component system chemotaxis response regulator CheB